MINTNKLHRELIESGIPIESCNSEGVILFKPEATQAQRDLAATILLNHNPYDYIEERRKDYWECVTDLGDRVTRLETYQKVEGEDSTMVAQQLQILSKEVHGLSLKINTLEAQRNTVIGVAGFLGGIVGFLGNVVFKTMTGNGR